MQTLRHTNRLAGLDLVVAANGTVTNNGAASNYTAEEIDGRVIIKDADGYIIAGTNTDVCYFQAIRSHDSGFRVVITDDLGNDLDGLSVEFDINGQKSTVAFKDAEGVFQAATQAAPDEDVRVRFSLGAKKLTSVLIPKGHTSYPDLVCDV